MLQRSFTFYCPSCCGWHFPSYQGVNLVTPCAHWDLLALMVCVDCAKSCFNLKGYVFLRFSNLVLRWFTSSPFRSMRSYIFWPFTYFYLFFKYPIFPSAWQSARPAWYHLCDIILFLPLMCLLAFIYLFVCLPVCLCCNLKCYGWIWWQSLKMSEMSRGTSHYILEENPGSFQTVKLQTWSSSRL